MMYILKEEKEERELQEEKEPHAKFEVVEQERKLCGGAAYS